MSDETQDNAVTVPEQDGPIGGGDSIQIKRDEPAPPTTTQLFAAARITDVLPPAAYEKIGTALLTPEQEAVLDEPTPNDEVDIRPDGLIYVSHEYIRRKLNKALGRMGWTLVPGSPLTKRPNSDEYYQRWILFIGGVYCSEALASRTYYEKRQQQGEDSGSFMSIDDLAESIKSDCLRRCAKDLGIGSEAWNRRFQERWKREYAVNVKVKTWKGEQRQWRRIDAGPMTDRYGNQTELSVGGADQRPVAGKADEVPSAASPAMSAEEAIKEAQRHPREPDLPSKSANLGGASKASAAPAGPATTPPAGTPPSSGRSTATAATEGGGQLAGSAQASRPASDNPKAMSQGQGRHMMALLRDAELWVGSDPTAAREWMEREAGVEVIGVTGKTDEENCIAQIRLIGGGDAFSATIKKLNPLAEAGRQRRKEREAAAKEQS